MMDGGEHKNGIIGFMTLSFGCKDQSLFFYWFGWYVKTKYVTNNFCHTGSWTDL